ncbi:MAG: hypothetical protein ACE5I1_15905 [bacterium]
MLVSLKQTKTNRPHAGRAMFITAYFLVTLAIILATTSSLLANPDQKRENLIDRVLQQLYTEAYDSALANCQLISKLWPQDPTASILQLSIYQTQMRIYRVRIFEAKFDSLIARAVEMADRQAKKNKTAQMLFMQGSARGMQALHRAKQGKIAKALKDAVFALHYMKKALRKDRNFADPKLSLGLYQFWKSEKLSFGLGLRKNDRKQALRLIEDVWKRGRYLSMDAAFTLQNIYLHKGDYSKALEINAWLVERYPSHPSVLYHRALLFENLERPSEALPCWMALIDRIRSFQAQSDGYLAECYLHIAQIYESMNASANGEKIEHALEQAALYAERRDASIELESSFQKSGEIHAAIKRLDKKYSTIEL